MKTAFQRKSSDPSEEHFMELKDINITTVDSFQASIDWVVPRILNGGR